MKSIELQFYEFCKENNITINDTSSRSTIERLKLAMQQKGKAFDFQDYVSAYKKGKLEFKELKSTKEAEEILLDVFNEGAKRNKFINLPPRERLIATLKMRYDEANYEHDAMLNSVIGLQKKETSWALMGGLASGLAGGAAGLAVAADVQRRNAATRQYNSDMREMGAYILANSSEYKDIVEELSRISDAQEIANKCLVEETNQDLYFSKLKIDKPSIAFLSDNRFVIFAEFRHDSFKIYDDVTAEITGILNAEIYDGDKLVATVDAHLPVDADSYMGTIISAGLIKHTFTNKPTVKITNKKIWAIEYCNYYCNYGEELDNSLIKKYIKKNNEHIVQSGISIAKEKLVKAQRLINSTNNAQTVSVQLDYYKQALNLLESISNFENSSELIKDCKDKIPDLELKVKIEKEINDAKKKANRKKILIGLCAVALIALVIFFITKDMLKYNSANKDIENGNYFLAYTKLTELGDYKDSFKKSEEIKALSVVDSLKTKELGDTVFFGKYEQDNNLDNGAEDIEWIVYRNEDGQVKLLSKYVLDFKYFHPNNSDSVLWENSYIRKWLNNDFYNQAFNNNEKSLILDYEHEQMIGYYGENVNNWYRLHYYPQKNVKDKVSLTYVGSLTTLGETLFYCYPTEYALAQPEAKTTIDEGRGTQIMKDGYCRATLTGDSRILYYSTDYWGLTDETRAYIQIYSDEYKKIQELSLEKSTIAGVRPVICFDLSTIQ